MTKLIAFLKLISGFLGFLQDRIRAKELQDARSAGADKARADGSQEVDELLIDATRARDQISDAEWDILDDPDRRDDP